MASAWEYKTTSVTTQDFKVSTNELNREGTEGWELVSVVFNPQYAFIYTAFWRRRSDS
jgi:hypothetical protein